MPRSRPVLLPALVVAAFLLVPLGAAWGPSGSGGSPIHRAEHFLDVGDGATLHVVERWSDASLAREPRRAILMVTATLVTEAQWDSDVPGDPTFNSLDLAAEQGFFAYAATTEGYGQSSHPADGRTVTAERILREMGVVLEWARARSGAEKVDLLGSSLGSSIAFALGGAASPVDPSHVGKVVLTSHIYRQPTVLLQVLLATLGCGPVPPPPPDGYMDTLVAQYAIILWNSEPLAQLWAYQTFPGHYAMGPTSEGCDFPVFTAEQGRAPVMVFWGDHDLLASLPDLEQFCAEYGGPCSITQVPGMGHAPNFEATRHVFWEDVWEFLG